MADPVSNIGVPKCPHCLEPTPPDLRPVKRLDLFFCPLCAKTFVIARRDVEYTTHPTNLDPNDIE